MSPTNFSFCTEAFYNDLRHDVSSPFYISGELLHYLLNDTINVYLHECNDSSNPVE